jgi:hypothetical protein
MSVTIQLLSGSVYEFNNIRDLSDLRRAASDVLDVVPSSRISFTKRREDGEFIPSGWFVADGDHFYAVVKDSVPPPTTVYLDFTGDRFILVSESDQELMDFTLPDVSLVPERLTLIVRCLGESTDYIAEQLGRRYESRIQAFDDYYQIFIAPFVAERVAVTMFY